MITLIFTCETAQSILSFFYPMEEFIVANDFHGYKYTGWYIYLHMLLFPLYHSN